MPHEMYFENSIFITARFVVATGLPEVIGRKSEVVDLIDPKAKYQRYQLLLETSARWGSIGGIINNKLVIGGGYACDEYFQDCFIIGEEEKKISLKDARFAASSVNLQDNLIWIVGGHDGFHELCSTEFIDSNLKVRSGPYLPFTISWHSMVHYDEKAIYIIGGKQDCQTSSNTWIANPENNFNITEGPGLNVARAYHCSAKMEVRGKNVIVVAGGDGEGTSLFSKRNYLNSVEILLPSSEIGWQKGPKLPFKMSTGSMVTSPTGRGVVVIGGWNNKAWTYSSALIELHGESMKWIPLKQTLVSARVGHVVLPAPDYYDELTNDCHGSSKISLWEKIKQKLNKARL